MNKYCILSLILCCFLIAPGCKKPQEEPLPEVADTVEKDSPSAMIEEYESMVEEGGKTEVHLTGKASGGK